MNSFFSRIRSLALVLARPSVVAVAIAFMSFFFSPAQPAQSQEILINADGPLPFTTTIPYPADEAILYLSGSAWSQTKDTFIGVDLLINNEKVWTAKIFSNGTRTHRTLMDNWMDVNFPCVLSDGQCADITITLQNSSAYPNTLTDINDYFQLVML